MTSQITKDINNVYYDCVIPNHGAFGFVPAVFNEERVQDIVPKGSDYQLSVIRFSIPGYTIPLRIVDTLGTDANTLAYSVTLTRGAATSGQIYIQWIPEENFPIPLSFDQPDSINNFQYYSLFSYQYFVDLVNTAFATAFTSLGALGNQTAPPYITFNQSTALFTLVVQESYITDPTPIKIFMNQKLFLFFNSFNNRFFPQAGLDPSTTGQDYQLIVKYNYDSIPGTLAGFQPLNRYTAPPETPAANTTVLNMTQDFSTMGNWNGVKGIIFTTGSIPIRKEFQSTLDESGNQNTIPIITDFIPLSQNGTENRTDIVYNPTAEYRMIDIIDNNPIRKFQISLFWQNNHLKIFPIFIGPADYISLKFIFRRKRL